MTEQENLVIYCDFLKVPCAMCHEYDGQLLDEDASCSECTAVFKKIFIRVDKIIDILKKEAADEDKIRCLMECEPVNLFLDNDGNLD